MKLVFAALEQLRPKQWAKNVLLFAALIFSSEFLSLEMVGRTVLGFVAFSMVSSAGYVLNDLLDREADRRHPKKRRRPIASGRLPIPVAIVLFAVVAALGVALSLQISVAFFALTMFYLATTMSYSYYFKHVVILDVMLLATGFVWRALAGAAAIEVTVSPWFFACTAFLALFLGFNKRYAELRQVGAEAGTRKTLDAYTLRMLEHFQMTVTSGVILTYTLYTVMGTERWMAVTAPIVLYGVFRWVYLVEQRGEGAAPEDTLFRDRPLLVTVALYGLAVVVILTSHALGMLPGMRPW
ncbi:MAG: decaprenyl-phosphate phosphoribosyltransferase [Deltaproteobacteria bacterium]|nr:decaprenyl-phosphate phosphoribosyltransferase [Deltaproteobacteria bacterium]